MHSATLLRLLASLCLLVALALPGCAAKSGPSTAPGGGFGRSADAAPASAEARGRMGTRGDFESYARADAPGPAPEAYGADRAAEPYHQPYDYDDAAVATAPTVRPGLGTRYGEQHQSHVTSAPFMRGASQPDVLLALWYNDIEGVRQAQGAFGSGFDSLSQASTSDGVFVVSVVDESGHAMSSARVGDKRYVVGQPGQRYKLTVQNNSPHRYEVVASVDGLDIIDGESASFAKRGYILDPWSSVTIDGWRTSHDRVAAFRFSGMEDSYADRKGEGRNIGVIGFAFFHERGGVPWQELRRRDAADPFPQRFAEPPPPRRVH
jgi:hypothetical protein